MCKSVITEIEYDRLAEQSQMKYLFCPNCKKFYLITDKQYHNNCGCDALVTDPRD